jgi:hypothetical protein
MYCGDVNVGQNCAIGNALFALFKGRTWVNKHNISVYENQFLNLLNEENKRLYLISLPENAQEFIVSFDRASPERRLHIDPISFDIEIPEPLVKELGLDFIHKVVKTEEQLELV